MALPHPKTRNEKYRKENKPNCRGVVWNFFKRTVNITEYWNATDDVNPAQNRPFDPLVHDVILYDSVMISDGAVEARSASFTLA
jgi:hypothetical protein